jgi:hypothetical protein
MAKTVDSQALAPVNKALGLAGSGDSRTELLDASLEQVLEVGPIVRRGRTVGPSEGIFRCTLRNIHAGAGSLSTAWQPYASPAAGLIAPFPSPVPDSLDVWVLGVCIQSILNQSNFNKGFLRLTNIVQGFGVDNLANAIVSTSIFTLATFDAIDNDVTPDFGITNAGLPYQPVNMRLPRKGAVASPFLRFDSDYSGVGTAEMLLLMGLFPLALGQDAAF